MIQAYNNLFALFSDCHWAVGFTHFDSMLYFMMLPMLACWNLHLHLHSSSILHSSWRVSAGPKLESQPLDGVDCYTIITQIYFLLVKNSLYISVTDVIPFFQWNGTNLLGHCSLCSWRNVWKHTFSTGVWMFPQVKSPAFLKCITLSELGSLISCSAIEPCVEHKIYTYPTNYVKIV